jgi:two-component system chemotaxis response regulator CheY
VGNKAKHGKVFRKCAVGIGLQGKMTSTEGSEEFLTEAKEWVKLLGEYPHAILNPGGRPTNKQTTRMVKCQCEECGYQVVGEAQNGLEAIDKYVRTRPHLVTLDIVMPELNGIDAAQEIFKYDPDAKVIVITSSLSQKTRLKAEELGVRSFVVKPITLDKLKMALELLKSPTKEVKYG